MLRPALRRALRVQCGPSERAQCRACIGLLAARLLCTRALLGCAVCGAAQRLCARARRGHAAGRGRGQAARARAGAEHGARVGGHPRAARPQPARPQGARCAPRARSFTGGGWQPLLPRRPPARRCPRPPARPPAGSRRAPGPAGRARRRGRRRHAVRVRAVAVSACTPCGSCASVHSAGCVAGGSAGSAAAFPLSRPRDRCAAACKGAPLTRGRARRRARR